MIFLFIFGYVLIAFEHNTKINKAAIAISMGALLWVIYIYISPSIVSKIYPQAFSDYLAFNSNVAKLDFVSQIRSFVLERQVLNSIGAISETVIFLLAAMTIVELIDVHGGFLYITNHIRSKKKRKLLWIIAVITFFMSSLLDNLTTTIVMIMLIRKIIPRVKDRWIYGSMVVIAANCGGAWSPIGDVTTIMLWVKGNITAQGIIPHLFVPSFISMIVPLSIIQFMLKGNVSSIKIKKCEVSENNLLSELNPADSLEILILGVGVLVLTPVFKSVTGLPPFMGLLIGLGIIWIHTDIMYSRKSNISEDLKVRVSRVFNRLDFSTLLFFIGILLAVDALAYSGILKSASLFLSTYVTNVYLQDIIIGFFSSVIDNVPLVAGAIGMYPVTDSATIAAAANPEFLQNFTVDGVFWQLLAYCAGVGGSILIIGSAAGVVFMGLEKVPFGWYMKKISLIAILGYIVGVLIIILQNILIS